MLLKPKWRYFEIRRIVSSQGDSESGKIHLDMGDRRYFNQVVESRNLFDAFPVGALVLCQIRSVHGEEKVTGVYVLAMNGDKMIPEGARIGVKPKMHATSTIINKVAVKFSELEIPADAKG
jgi:hypothetical protein